MNSRLAGTLSVWFVAGVALAAADFWETKDFTTWSDKEVEKMLGDSPWSREVTGPLGRMRGGRGGDAEGGGGGGRGGGGGSIGPGRPGIGGGGGYGPPGGTRRIESRPSQAPLPRKLDLTISWRSALPFKLALVREGIGIDARIPREQQEFLAKDEPFYVVTVSGFPRRFAQIAERGMLTPETMLKREETDPIGSDDIRVVSHDGTVVVLCFFPRTDPITLDDKDVEFILTMGPLEVKKKFKLKDMVFGGDLTL